MGARMLVIEDNPTNLELMTYLLAAFGHSALSAKTGEEGVTLALEQHPDLILCDIHLPDINGFEVFRRIRAAPQLADVKVIAVTASAMAGDRESVLAHGFDGYMSKPIVPETFVPDVERFLDNSDGHDPRR
jgi:CheY-like chemotaxis protein